VLACDGQFLAFLNEKVEVERLNLYEIVAPRQRRGEEVNFYRIKAPRQCHWKTSSIIDCEVADIWYGFR
jgi:hypothetical protein